MKCFALSVAERLIRRVQAEGIAMHACGRRLHLRAASPPIPELLEAIRVHKDEILEALWNDRQSLSIGCLKPPDPATRRPPTVRTPRQQAQVSSAVTRTTKTTKTSRQPHPPAISAS